VTVFLPRVGRYLVPAFGTRTIRLASIRMRAEGEVVRSAALRKVPSLSMNAGAAGGYREDIQYYV
jgi:hypothetical protein